MGAAGSGGLTARGLHLDLGHRENIDSHLRLLAHQLPVIYLRRLDGDIYAVQGRPTDPFLAPDHCGSLDYISQGQGFIAATSMKPAG